MFDLNALLRVNKMASQFRMKGRYRLNVMPSSSATRLLKTIPRSLTLNTKKVNCSI